MKKAVLVLSLIFVVFSTPALASWADDILAAIASGHVEKVDGIATNNTGAQGDIAFFLLQQADTILPDNICLAAKVFDAAKPYVSKIPEFQLEEADQMIKKIAESANDPKYRDNACAKRIIASANTLDVWSALTPGVPPRASSTGVLAPSAE